MLRSLPPALALALALSACSTGEVDLSGKQCPCAGGWVCDRSQNLCVRALDGAPADAGADGGAPDAGPAEAGPPDTGPADARGPDAGSPCQALMIIDPANVDTADPAVVERIETVHGCPVASVPDSAAEPEDAAGKALILISSTARSGIIGGLFRGSTVPVITWEAYVYPDMGMSDSQPGRHFGFTAPGTELTILLEDHPLAGGRTGTVAWLDVPVQMAWLSPEGEGVVVANVTGLPDGGVRPGIVAFRRGDTTIAERAAGCRIGLPLWDSAPGHLTEEGWALFDGTITWALAGCP